LPSPAPKHAADLRGALSIGLQEALRSLEEALDGLTEAQFVAFPMIGEESIALMALRAIQNLDDLAVVAQGGAPSFAHSDDWGPAGLTDAADYVDDALFPTLDQVREWLAATRRSAEPLLEAATSDDLCQQRDPRGPWPGTASSAYLAAVFHAISQVQRIWLLRGLLRAPGRSRKEAALEASGAGTEPPRTVAELHYGAMAAGNLFLWRATLVRELRSPRRVPGLAPTSWWEAGRRAVAAGAQYHYLGEGEHSATQRTLLFSRDGDAGPGTVAIQLVRTQEGWRVSAAEY